MSVRAGFAATGTRSSPRAGPLAPPPLCFFGNSPVWDLERAYDAGMKSFLTAVAVVIAVIFVLKVVAAATALVLAFVPAAVALLGGLAVGYRLGKRRERDRLQAKAVPRLP